MTDPTLPFPHSAQFLARQAARQKEIARLTERLGWTDAQFLAERDAVYVADERKCISYQIETQQRDMHDDNDTEGYVAFYHTDEG